MDDYVWVGVVKEMDGEGGGDGGGDGGGRGGRSSYFISSCPHVP